MSSQAVPTIYQHVDNPQWGCGVILPSSAGRADRLDLSFETGGRRILLKRFADKLTPVAMSSEEALRLGHKLASGRTHGAPGRVGKPRPKGAAAAATFATFEAQLAHFEASFPGGFAGEKFEQEERGLESAKRRKTHKAPGIADAVRWLGRDSFDEGDEAQLFASAVELLATTSFVHPLEGSSSLGSMKPEHRPEFVAALRELLHGTHDEGDRFERFVASLRLPDASGSPRRASWPLATVFAALVHPTRHVCVKPTFFQKQAALLKVAMDYSPVPNAAGYARFLETARKTEAALRNAGQAPRDLVDVASFICLTQAAKPAVTPSPRAA